MTDDTFNLGKNNSEEVKRSDDVEIDINKIYERIAPYISNTEFIRQTLEENRNLPRNKFIELIENKIKKSDPPYNTDLRILLNSI